ncbi:sensor histidine kinase [uncultured Fibrella sp.]|uniref:sensor histidine kinase n=1 Tax=uncultured Fibrella sp. TaxID=1284596 RepID=UPI0035C95A23
MLFRLIWAVGLLVITLPLQAQTTRQDSLRIVKITKDSARIMEFARLGLVIMYDRSGKYKEALPYLERAEAEVRETRSPLLINHVRQKRAELEWVAGHWPKALTLFLEAERTYSQLVAGKTPNAASLRNHVLLMKLRIGQVQTDNIDYVHAHSSLMGALQYARDQQLTAPKEQRLVANIYNSLSILEGKLNHQEKSLAYADTAALRSRAAGDEYGYFSALLNTAITRKNLKQYAASVRQYEACARYFASQRDSFALMLVYDNIPRALLGLNRVDEGITYARKALAMSNQTSDRMVLQADIHDALSTLYEAKGNTRLALAEFKLAKAQQDTLFKKDREKQMQELSAKYEDEKKEAAILELSREKEQRTRQLTGLGGGAVLLSLLLGLSLHQSKRLRAGSKRIQRQAEQLQLLMKELHHRAKNNLAIVSGLLELQANRTQDVHTRQAFREGQQRIQAMSLIHQRLYQTSELTAVDLREYISHLVQSLMNTYGYTTDTIELRLSLSADAVDADVAIPLGLIINEVLTNSFKYAFQEAPNPTLGVTLKTTADTLLLEMADNGPGIDLAVWESARGSFGKQLIRSLSQQLDADLTVENRQGTYVGLRVPMSNPNQELAAERNNREATLLRR